MGEIVIKFNDDMNYDKIFSILAPYIENVGIKKNSRKKWSGKAEWLDTPIKMDSFTPLSREEAHER